MSAFARSLVWIVAGTCWLAAQATAAPPSPEHLAKLIADLGSEEFTVRESATEELTRIGLPAFAALEAAATHPDREVRYRSQRILGLIREHDLKRRLEAFQSGQELDGEYPLPGWTRFKKSYGDNATVRALFVEMQRADADLLRAIEESPRLGGDQVSQRVGQLQDWARVGVPQQVTRGQVAAVLFVAAEADVTLSGTSQLVLLNQCFQQTFREHLGEEAKNDLPRRMLGAIIRRADDTAAYQAMYVAQQLRLSEGIVPALRLLAGKDEKAQVVRSPSIIAYALAYVAGTGDAEHLPKVEKFLTDNSRIVEYKQNGVSLEVQLRDAALAATIVLHKQELKDFFNLQGKNLPPELRSVLVNPTLIGFKSEDERSAVFQKWEAYQAKR